ncbi:MAG: JAB domain-containing protein [Cyclobacteriaceae bacterium]
MLGRPLNRANKVIGIYEVSTGTTVGTIADPLSVFVPAIKTNACDIIVSHYALHNSHHHPSGNLQLSQDIDLTKKMKDGGKLLEVQILDHLILTTEGYYSFAEGF